MSEKKPTYEERRHELDSKMLRASSLANEQEQQSFVNQTFVEIHKWYAEKQINHEDYIKLINRLAAFNGGKYNDHLDTLVGAATMGMLDVVLHQNIPAFSPERSRQRSKTVTGITGVEPVQPDTE